MGWFDDLVGKENVDAIAKAWNGSAAKRDVDKSVVVGKGLANKAYDSAVAAKGVVDKFRQDRLAEQANGTAWYDKAGRYLNQVGNDVKDYVVEETRKANDKVRPDVGIPSTAREALGDQSDVMAVALAPVVKAGTAMVDGVGGLAAKMFGSKSVAPRLMSDDVAEAAHVKAMEGLAAKKATQDAIKNANDLIRYKNSGVIQTMEAPAARDLQILQENAAHRIGARDAWKARNVEQQAQEELFRLMNTKNKTLYR